MWDGFAAGRWPRWRLACALLAYSCWSARAARVGAVTTWTVCFTPDAGFNMLREGVTTADVDTDSDVEGFDSDVVAVLTQRLNQPYTLRGVASYGSCRCHSRGRVRHWLGALLPDAAREKCLSHPQHCAAMPADVSAIAGC